MPVKIVPITRSPMDPAPDGKKRNVRQPFACPGNGRAGRGRPACLHHVGGGNDPDRDIAVFEILENGHQEAKAGPLDKGDQDVHRIG